MATEKRLSAIMTLQADQAKQELESLRAAEARVTAEGTKLGGSVSNALEDVEVAVAKAFRKMSDGGTVSTSEFDKLLGKYASAREIVEQAFPDDVPKEFADAIAAAQQQLTAVASAMQVSRDRVTELREQFVGAGVAAAELATKEKEAAELAATVADKFGDIPAEIEKLRGSDRLLEEQEEQLKEILQRLREEEAEFKKLGTAGERAMKDIRTPIDQVERALRDLASESQSAMGKMRDQTVRVDRAMKDLDDSVADASPKMVANFARAGIQVDRLREEIEQVRRAGGVVTEAQLDQLKQYEQRLTQTRAKVEDLSDSLGDMKATTAEGGAQWTGLVDAIKDAAGPLGSVIAKFGLFAAAAKEGWSTGMQLNQFFRTDMSEWEEATTRWGTKTGIIIREISDSFLALWKLQVEAMTPGEGWAKRVQGAYAALKEELKENVKVMGDLDAEIKRHNEAVKAAEEAQKRQREEAEKAKQAAEKLAAAKKQLAENIHDVTKALREQASELEKEKRDGEEARIRLTYRSADLQFYRQQLDETTRALEAQRREVDRLTQQHGANDPFTLAAIERQQQLEVAVRVAREQYNRAAQDVDRYTDTIKSSESAQAKSKDSITDLTKKLNEQQKELNSLGGATAQTTAAANASTVAVAAQAQATAQAAAATTAATEATKKAADEIKIYQDETGKWVVENKKATETNQNYIVSTDQVTKSTAAATETMRKLAEGPKPFLAAGEGLDELKEGVVGVREELERLRDLVVDIGIEVPKTTKALEGIANAGQATKK